MADGRAKDNSQRYSVFLAYLAVGVITVEVFAPLYYEMARGRLSSDIPAHAEILQKALKTGHWLPHPGLHVLALALLGFPDSPSWKSLIIVLSGITLAALLAKHLVAAACVASWEPSPSPRSQRLHGVSVADNGATGLRLATLTMCLCVAGPVWSPEIGWDNFYIGKFSPNLWHNPTLLLSWPLIILHFAGVVQYLNRPGPGRLCQILLCEAFATIIKPNYTLALCGALPLTFLLSGFRSRVWLKVVAFQLVIAGMVLLPQWIVFRSGENAAMGVAPLAVVSERSSFVPLTFLTSIVFPLTVAVVLRRTVIMDRAFQLAAVLFLVAAAQAYLLVEGATARGVLDGNWFWGGHATLFLLFLVSLTALCRTTFVEMRRDRGVYACWGAFGLHVVSGIAWLGKYFLGYGYF